MSIDIVIEDERWSALDALASRAADAIWDKLHIPAQEFCILACNDTRISELNSNFRRKFAPTNVLSWPSEERGAETPGDMPDLPDRPDEIGDIAISYDTCLKEADEAQKPFEDHVTHLIIHGILHLLGFDHIEDADADLMEGLEIHILASLGLPNPYVADQA